MSARAALRLVLLLVLAVPAAAAIPLPAPTVLPGPLVIVGGGKMPDDARKAFFDLAGGKKAKIVVVPTAAAEADDDAKADGFLREWQALEPESVTLLHTRDRKTADDPAFSKALAEATGLWFSGGDQTKIAEAYRGTAAAKAFHALHARGGVVGGTSAGAAILSDPMIAGGTDTARVGPGLGFFPGFVVDQHFTQRKRLGRLQGMIAANPTLVGLGIDEATAVVARGRTFRVIGEGTVSIVIAKGAGKPPAFQVAKAGGLFDTAQLRRAAANRAAAEPFPPAKPADPVVKSGALLVVGGGGAGPEIWKTFIDLAGGPDAPIVVIPTALEDPLPPEIGEEKALKRFGAKAVTSLHTRDRKVADDPKFSEALVKAKGVWFSGGRQWKFVDAYEGTITEKRFHDVLARGGVIGGSSAGASIQSEYMPRGHPLGNTVMAAEGYEKGFGFLPGCAVDQHFFARKRTADMTGLMADYPQYLGIGIDEGTAIVVKGSRAEVIGRTKVAFYDTRRKQDANGPDYQEVKTGETYDLVRRAKVE
ncbi:MAG TPA: cyanophycinase [Urbifossiella sp.]|jgi:cyanophycinase|nr:cyanophycinase [Urbifossiella sp.]